MDIALPSQLSVGLLSTALVLLDDQNKIIQLNPAAEQLLGFSNRHIESDSFFQLVGGDLSANAINVFREQEKSGFIEDVELRVATGAIRTNLMVTPCEIVTGDDLLLEFQTSAHLQNIRKDLQIQQQSRVSEHLIRNLAHEIKNPLGGIKGAAQLLARKLPSDFPDKYSQVIIREADRLGALVDRLLMPARPEVAQLVNPHLVIEQALEIVLLQSAAAIAVKKDYDPSLPELLVSQNQIQQVMLNLIKNATEALHQKLDSAELTLRTRMMHQHTIGQSQYRQVLRIDIEDNGDGISDALSSDIFFPTISGKESSGLGLSIAQSLVQRHQGIIELDSRQNPTRFSIYIPVINDNHHIG